MWHFNKQKKARKLYAQVSTVYELILLGDAPIDKLYEFYYNISEHNSTRYINKFTVDKLDKIVDKLVVIDDGIFRECIRVMTGELYTGDDTMDTLLKIVHDARAGLV